MIFKKLLLLNIIFQFINYCYCQYSYNITVFVASIKFKGSKGNIYETLLGGNGLYNHTVKINSESENFKSGDVKTYITEVPWPIEYIEKLELWFESVDKSFIYIDKIVINPVYITNPSARQLSIRGYCSTTVHAEVGIDKVPFWIRC